MRRKAGRPKQSRYKPLFEKGGSREKDKKDEKKDAKPKRPPKGKKNRCKSCEELRHRDGSTKCRYTDPKGKKRVFQPLVTEPLCPAKRQELGIV
jgi:hypothetical protein